MVHTPRGGVNSSTPLGDAIRQTLTGCGRAVSQTVAFVAFAAED